MRTAFTSLVGVPHPIAGFNRSPGVVAAVTNAGGLGVLAASAYTPEELDAQLTWIEEQTGGRPYGVDLLVPEKFVPGDPDDLIASLRAQIPQQHLAFIRGLLDQYGIPDLAALADNSGIVAGLNPGGAEALLDVAFSHRISLVASALGTPPPSLVARAKAAGVVVAALVGQARHAERQMEAGVNLLIAQGTEAGGHTGTIATMVLTPEIVDMRPAGRCWPRAGSRPAARWPPRWPSARPACGAARSGWPARRTSPSRPSRTSSCARPARTRCAHRPAPASPPGNCAAPGTTSGTAPDAPAPLPMPLQPMLVNAAWQRIDQAAADGHPGALRLESFYVGQVVGSFQQIRQAAEITRELVAGCEQRIAELAGLLPAS